MSENIYFFIGTINFFVFTLIYLYAQTTLTTLLMNTVVLLCSVSGAISEGAARGPPFAITSGSAQNSSKKQTRVADKLEPYFQ